MIYIVRKSYVLLKKRFRTVKKKLERMHRFNSWMIGILFYLGTLLLVLRGMNLLVPLEENGLKIIGTAISVFIFLLIAFFYLYRFKSPLLKSPSKIFLLALVVWGTLLTGYGIFSSRISDYSVPAVLAGIVLASFLQGQGALICVVVLGGLLGLIANFRIDIVLSFVVAGGVASLGVSFTHKRTDLLKVGILAGVIGAVFIASWGWLQEWAPEFLLIQSLWMMGSGVISAFLALGILPILENLFGMLTDAKLFELSHLTNPLLINLREKAPGTYQSSLMVANLAEAAAEKIHANPLLVRVGAYYHDIGKIKNPSYFVENDNINGKSKHERINPPLSSLILISHVKEGLQLAQKYRLPREIQEMIKQHHGTTLTSFFYQKAREKDHHNTLKEEDFRYPGPKPESKEAAVLMLADTVEAASRTLENPSPARIRALVEKLLRDKFMDRQLDESQLTFKELLAIEESFIQTLTGTFHTRIEYPAPEKGNGHKPKRKRKGD
ncbi:MAG TPA: HDIG domain-containing protein [Candidatus Omnitrophica bacterium]|nr:HDIG domain-containing protein [Candidatus Omnitrophota bacterium]